MEGEGRVLHRPCRVGRVAPVCHPMFCCDESLRPLESINHTKPVPCCGVHEEQAGISVTVIVRDADAT